MTLGEKFKTGEEFLKYSEAASGMNFDDEKVIAWYNKNKDFKLSYTGIMKVLNKFKIKKNTKTS